jgi:hypothetical protein
MKAWRIIACLVACGGPVTSWAASDYVSLQNQAQGQSLVGSSTINDSLYTNPAGSIFTQVYSVDATYGMPKDYAASILDTKTSGFGGGLGYFRKGVGSVTEPLQGVTLALLSKLRENFGIGITGKSIWGPNTLGRTDRMNDGDVGALYNINPLQLGFTVRNVLGGSTVLDDSGREWALGARLNYRDTFFISAAATARWSKFAPYQYGFGAEYVSPYYFSLKGGYRIVNDAYVYNTTTVGGVSRTALSTGQHQSFWSVGGSFITPRLSIHYAMLIPQQNGNVLEHLFGGTVLF